MSDSFKRGQHITGYAGLCSGGKVIVICADEQDLKLALIKMGTEPSPDKNRRVAIIPIGKGKEGA